jgi:hypothetical protein
MRGVAPDAVVEGLDVVKDLRGELAAAGPGSALNGHLERVDDEL